MFRDWFYLLWGQVRVRVRGCLIHVLLFDILGVGYEGWFEGLCMLNGRGPLFVGWSLNMFHLMATSLFELCSLESSMKSRPPPRGNGVEGNPVTDRCVRM